MAACQRRNVTGTSPCALEDTHAAAGLPCVPECGFMDGDPPRVMSCRRPTGHEGDHSQLRDEPRRLRGDRCGRFVYDPLAFGTQPDCCNREKDHAGACRHPARLCDEVFAGVHASYRCDLRPDHRGEHRTLSGRVVRPEAPKPCAKYVATVNGSRYHCALDHGHAGSRAGLDQKGHEVKPEPVGPECFGGSDYESSDTRCAVKAAAQGYGQCLRDKGHGGLCEFTFREVPGAVGPIVSARPSDDFARRLRYVLWERGDFNFCTVISFMLGEEIVSMGAFYEATLEVKRRLTKEAIESGEGYDLLAHVERVTKGHDNAR